MSEQDVSVPNDDLMRREPLDVDAYEPPLTVVESIGRMTLGSTDREYADAIGQYSWTKPKPKRFGPDDTIGMSL